MPIARQPTPPASVPFVGLPGVWRSSELGQHPNPVQATGWAQLDAELPGGGWPSRSLTEVLLPQPATLEWRLLGPALGKLASAGRQIAAIAPPHQPYLPGLQQNGLHAQRLVWIRADKPAERLWATEQLIKANACGAVLAWLPQARPEQVRRLQVCAQSCDGLVFLCRPESTRHESSAAPLRVLVRPALDWQLHLQILKRRGPTLDETIRLASTPGGLVNLITPRLEHPSRFFRQEAPAHAVDRPVAINAFAPSAAVQ